MLSAGSVTRGVAGSVLAVAMVSLLCCTAMQRSAVAKTIADIAAEVCVEGDSFSVCLKKCEAAAPKE